jgi:glycosyltransferase involved in cell wall biosynthesis
MIDVLLPFYGDPDLFKLAVRSVLSQTDPGWRLVVVDDCDPGPGVASWLASLDEPRITYLRNPENLGVAGNFRRCLDLAAAEHVTFLGCDDVMHANYVRVVHDSLGRNPDAAVVQPRVQVIDSDGRVVSTLVDAVKSRLAPSRGAELVLSGEDLAVSLVRGNWMYFPAVTWRRELIAARQFRLDMETALDLDLLLHLVADGHAFAFPDELAFSYRRHASSASSVSAREVSRFEEESRLFAEFSSHFASQDWTRAARESRRHLTSRLHAAALVPGALGSHRPGVAQSLLRHALARG